jgi:hypothetical protein
MTTQDDDADYDFDLAGCVEYYDALGLDGFYYLFEDMAVEGVPPVFADDEWIWDYVE